MNIKNTTMIDWFRHAAPYIQAHRGKTFVVAFSGEVFEHPHLNNLIHDIATLNSLGIKIVLVHGIRPQMNALLEKYNHQQDIQNDWRITDDTCLQVAQQASGYVKSKIEALFARGLPSTLFPTRSITATSGNFVIAKPLGVHEGTDYLHTGTVRKLNTEAINAQLDNNNIVVLSPLAYSPTGETLNCKYEEVAFNAAIHLQAEKLIYIASHNVVDAKEETLTELNIEQATDLTNHANTNKEIKNHLEAGIQAINTGISRVHLLSCAQDGSLLEELFTRQGSGTLISATPSEIIRTANIDDAQSILQLISPLQEQGILVKRSLEQLEMDINHFYVVEYEGAVIACAALYNYAKDKMAELACIAVDAQYQNSQIGRGLLNFLEKQAKQESCNTLFVLTTQTKNWFEEQGFKKDDINKLPIDKQSLYNYKRNSLVLFKGI